MNSEGKASYEVESGRFRKEELTHRVGKLGNAVWWEQD